MKKNVQKKLAMYERCELFFTENQMQLKGLAALEPKLSRFREALSELNQSIQQQLGVITGYTTEKENAKMALAKKLAPVSQKSMSWAIDNGYEGLASVFNFYASELARLSDKDVGGVAGSIISKLTEHAASMADHNITPAMTDELQSLLDAFTAAHLQQAGASEDRERATHRIAALEAEMDKLLFQTDKLIYGEFSLTDPDLMDRYGINRAVGRVNYRHTGILARIKAAGSGAPLEGIQVKIRELQRSVQSGIDGFAEMIRFRSGKYHVDFIMADEVKRTEIIEFKRGRILEVDVRL